MTLHGRLKDIHAGEFYFGDDLEKNLDNADRVYNGICGLIDDHIARNRIAAPASPHYEPVWRPGEPVKTLDPLAAGISSVIWTTGFRADWSWVELPIFDGAGYPTHWRGVTSMDGVYVLGMPWLYTWGSGRFVGVGRDAGYISEKVTGHLASRPAVQLAESAA
jgi:putative flavoprotein involved in K+ transport